MKQTDPQFKLRLPEDLKEQIEAAAQESKRSMNAEIVHRLQGSFLNKNELEDDDLLAEAVLERTGVLLAEHIKESAQQHGRPLLDELVSQLQHKVRDDADVGTASDVAARLERIEGLIRGIAGNREDVRWDSTHRAGVMGRVLLVLSAFELAGTEPHPPLTRRLLLDAIRDESKAAVSAAHEAVASFAGAFANPLRETEPLTNAIRSTLPDGILDVDGNWGDLSKDPLLNGKFERYLAAENLVPSKSLSEQKGGGRRKPEQVDSSRIKPRPAQR